MICIRGKDSFKAGAKWMQEEFLKGLFHPASEVPQNDNGKILAFSKVNSNMKKKNYSLWKIICLKILFLKAI